MEMIFTCYFREFHELDDRNFWIERPFPVRVRVRGPLASLIRHSLVPSPSFWVERKGEKECLGDNPGWKCPESRNSATGVDYESWPQLQGAKPLRRKSRKPDQVDIARY